MTNVTHGTELKALLMKPDGLMMPGEVAQLLRVDPKTVTRWIQDRRIADVVRTPGGQNRIRSREVRRILNIPETEVA